MSLTKKANLVLDEVEKLAATDPLWSDLSNAVFDQTSGLIARTFPDPLERQAFYDTNEYDRLYEIVGKCMKAQGVRAGATPQKSGKFVVRLPKTIHEVLTVEAKREGVSLNQLALSKLSLPLRERTHVDIALLVQAFKDTHDGYAPDRVVVDPDLDRVFLRRCREIGLNLPAYNLNHALFDVRKSKKAELPPTTKKTEFRDSDDYQFGSEIAVRVLQRVEGVTLDRILCDPRLAERFDAISGNLVNEKSILKRRWAALNLRKTRRLQPADLEGETYDLVSEGPLRSVPLDRLPELPATYVLYDDSRPLFAGETDNLRRRMSIHLTPGHLPEWVDVSEKSLTLKHFVAPKISAAERQRWLRQFINQERPLLNYQKTG